MTLFVDGSSRKNPDGTNATGYALVTQDEILEARPLPKHYSAQVAELVALTRACIITKGKSVTIYTDSQYAFSTVHVFAQQWKNRGMVTSSGKPISHTDFILELLDAIQLPKELAICKCQAHTKHTDPISEGNKRADEVAKIAAQETHQIMIELEIIEIDHTVLTDMQQNAPPGEK
ncbi:ribonuclease H-like [Rana temporaria]|uniref:ribonuclease H-like n=1 Tax=Rana temporaria TaxID=8407 RepID=UPI001AAD66A2|nr:ribonuclease H-like [Rana temporaria]